MGAAEVVPLVVGLLTMAAGIIAAVVASNSAKQARRANRVEQVEARLEKSDKDRHLLYLWNRELVDHIYRGYPPPPPDPPEGLFT